MSDFRRPIDIVRQLDGYQLGYYLEFAEPNIMPAAGGLLKAVMHDDRGTWLRYQETRPPRYIEHAHYVPSDTHIKLYPRES